MKPEEQRIAIAKANGWTGLSMPVGCPVAWEHKATRRGAINSCYLPDYLNDLNAMHEVEGQIPPDHHYCYASMLYEVQARTNPEVGSTEFTALAHAPSPQRAEAYLKTIGKWEERIDN